MFRAEGTPAYLRRKIAGEALALRAGRQTARSNVQLARVQGQQLSQIESHVAEKISGCGVVMKRSRLLSTPCLCSVRSAVFTRRAKRPNFNSRSKPHMSQDERPELFDVLPLELAVNRALAP